MEYIPAAFSALGSIEEGKQGSSALKRMAQANDQQTTAEEEQQRRFASQFAGEQAASMAQNGGVDLGVAKQNMVTAELDALNIRYSGRMKSADLRARAKTANRQGYLSGANALLNTYARSTRSLAGT